MRLTTAVVLCVAATPVTAPHPDLSGQWTFDAAQSDVQRDAALFPAFNQSPIHWAQHEMLAAPANESVFYF